MPPNLPRGMAFQIYQAWLQGPHALFRLFEDSFGRQALYGPPDPDMQQREIDDLSEQIGRLQARNERLQAEVGDFFVARCLAVLGLPAPAPAAARGRGRRGSGRRRS